MFRFVFTRRERRLDFMGALNPGAAFSEKESGALEGVAKSRVARGKACLAAFFAGPASPVMKPTNNKHTV